MLRLTLTVLALASCAADAQAAGRPLIRKGPETARMDCGPYGHRGPWGGCIPGGLYGAGNYYFLGPPYLSSRPYAGPPFYGQVPREDTSRDYGPAYWGMRDYGVPAFW